MTVIEFLKEEKINSSLIEGIMEFRASHPVREEDRGRIPVPRYLYYGRDVWEQAVAALLCGQNLLLTGPKATGKNILAQNLAAAFGRPVWDISLHVNMDASGLIGTDTFENAAESAGVLAYWMKSTWPEMRHWPCSMEFWISGGP